MMKEVGKAESNLHKHARQYAMKIVDFCLNDIDYPKDKFNYAPPISTISASYIRAFCISALGLKGITAEKQNDVVEYLLMAVSTTIAWIEIGYKLIYDEVGDLADDYPMSYCLFKFYREHENDSYISETIHEALYLVCLNDLADYKNNIMQTFMNKEDFKSDELKIKSYEFSIDALGSLICAQDAFERAQTRRMELAGYLGQKSLQEEYVKSIDEIQLFEKQKRSEGGKKHAPWKPFEKMIINEVNQYHDDKRNLVFNKPTLDTLAIKIYELAREQNEELVPISARNQGKVSSATLSKWIKNLKFSNYKTIFTPDTN